MPTYLLCSFLSLRALRIAHCMNLIFVRCIVTEGTKQPPKRIDLVQAVNLCTSASFVVPLQPHSEGISLRNLRIS